MKFFDWLISESLQIVQADPEDWEVAEKCEYIAKLSGIRIASNKELSLIAYSDDEPVGAVWAAFTKDDEASQETGEPIYHYDFDVAVLPKFRNGIGLKLIQAAEAKRKEYEEIYNAKAYTRLWVINPKLARVLQMQKYGYNAD